jgi:MFS family permease
VRTVDRVRAVGEGAAHAVHGSAAPGAALAGASKRHHAVTAGDAAGVNGSGGRPAAVAQDRPAGRGVLAAACVSALVVNANTSAVTILLPSISEDVGAPVAQLQWAVTGYSLVGAAVIVTSGALGDVLGRRKIFLGGLALFVASCALIALSTGVGGVVGGRMIQGAAGATILACGMSLLSVAASGAGQMKAITLWGAASAAGAALGPLVGGVLVDTTGWQGLFWIDAAIAAACVPLTLATVQESRDPNAPGSIDWAGTVLIALVLAPLVLALSKGNDWGWASAATLGCFAITVVATLVFLRVERRASAPLVNLALLRNRVLVGATLAILIVAGTINALMYVLSLYFQNPAAFGMSALEAGLATLPAAAGMIAITPLITPLAGRIGGGAAVALGFALAAAGFGALAFVEASWTYAAFVVPLVALAIGLGVANGPASSGSTASVSHDEVGQASGISNMARYIGAAVAVAIVATIFNSVTNNHQAAGESAADALAAGLGAASLTMAIWTVAGVALVRLLAGQRLLHARPIDRAAGAAATSYTIPVEPVTAREPKMPTGPSRPPSTMQSDHEGDRRGG